MGMGLTLLPDLAVRALQGKGQKNLIRPFAKPVPLREVSVVRTRRFAKQRIFNAWVEIIRETTPKELSHHDKGRVVPMALDP